MMTLRESCTAALVAATCLCGGGMAAAQSENPNPQSPTDMQQGTPSKQPGMEQGTPRAPNDLEQQKPSDLGQQPSDMDKAKSKMHDMTGEQTGGLTTGDREFIIGAAQGNLAEVKLGELAKEHSHTASVQKFAERMVKDHTKTLGQLKVLASKKSVDLPTTLTTEQQDTYDRLSKLNGADFDKAYMDSMVKDHDEDVSMFKQAASTAQDADVRAFASKSLPTLQSHQTMAHSASKNIKTM
jgi:putative membrane protein